MEDFKFDAENHIYTLDGRRLYGVTNVLSVISKPALIQWSADEAVKFLGWFNQKYDNSAETYLRFVKFWQENIQDKNADEFWDLLCKARVQHAKRKKDAGTKGTDVHAQIEEIIKRAIDKSSGYVVNHKNYENPQVNHFIDWANKNKIKFLISEAQLYSKSLWVAGTTDMVFMKDDKKFVGDIKTASGIYPENFYQMAAYRMMLEEMGEKDFVASAIIRLGKDGKFEESVDVQYHWDYETDKSAFLGALAIFKANESYKLTKGQL